MQSSTASFEPQTFDAEKRTVELTWTTGSKGLRGGFFSDPYHEELEVSTAAVRMSRLNSGAPLLNSHRGYDLESVLGVVESARIEDGKGVATVRFAKDPASDAIMQKVQDGILRNISVGYQIHKYRDVSKEGDKYRTLRAVDWEPMELSIVPIPFDAGAQVRSGETTTVETEIESPELPDNHRSIEMLTENVIPEAAPVVDAVKERAEAKAAERKRASDIMAVCRKVDMAAEAEAFIEADKSVEEVRALIIDKLAERSAATAVKGGLRVEAGDLDEVKTRREAIENAIMHRANPASVELSEPGRQYRSMTLSRLAESLLGDKARGMSRSEMAIRAITTSDLPLILANVANKSLRNGYAIKPRTFAPFVTFGTLPDYKESKRVQLSSASSLEQVIEHGEYTEGKLSESSETISLLKYGKKIKITEETIVNDDLQALTRIPTLMGAAAARLESKLVYDMLLANAAMSDGVALFHASHGNLGTTGVLSATTLTEMLEDMRLQTTLDGTDFAEVEPAFLIVGPAQEIAAKKLLTEIAANASGDVNVFAGMFRALIVDPRVTASKWFVAADPNQVDTIEVAYLEGMNGPEVSTFAKPEDDQVVFKVKHVVGVKAIDHRGLYYNAGS